MSSKCRYYDFYHHKAVVINLQQKYCSDVNHDLKEGTLSMSVFHGSLQKCKTILTLNRTENVPAKITIGAKFEKNSDYLPAYHCLPPSHEVACL